MPHISVKMLAGRSEEQKKRLSAALVKTLVQELHCSEQHVTCTVEDYTPEQWQKVFREEVSEKPAEVIYKKPEYDPKDLL